MIEFCSINFKIGFFHAYETLPLPTEKLSAAEIISLRDDAFNKYHNYKPFLNLIEKKFGKIAADN